MKILFWALGLLAGTFLNVCPAAAVNCSSGCEQCTNEYHCTLCYSNHYMNSYECFPCPANATCDGRRFTCNKGYTSAGSPGRCVTATIPIKSYDIYYRDATWTSNTHKNSTPVQASSLSQAASAIQSAWAPKYATCSGDSSANAVACSCDTKNNVRYFWIGANCTTYARSNPGVCYKAGTYYSAYDTTTSPANDCNTAYEKCPAGCAACSINSGIECTQCLSGYYKYNGSCVSSCPSGYTPENGSCVKEENPVPMSGNCPSPLKKSADGCCCVK